MTERQANSLKLDLSTTIQIVVVLLLTGFLVQPLPARIAKASLKNADLSRLRRLTGSAAMYVVDNDGAFFIFSWDGGLQQDYGPHWSDRVMPYIMDTSAFSDPCNRMKQHKTPYWRPGGHDKDDEDPKHIYRVTYTPNHLVAHSDDGYINWRPTYRASIELPESTVLFGPGNDYFSSSQCHVIDSKARLVWNVSADGSSWGYEIWGGISNAGYFGGACFAFTDGHARWCRLNRGADSVLGDAAGSMAAYFPEATTNPILPETDSCGKADRSSMYYGF